MFFHPFLALAVLHVKTLSSGLVRTDEGFFFLRKSRYIMTWSRGTCRCVNELSV